MQEQSNTETLPLAPVEMREMVGPTDPAAFDNPAGQPVFSGVPTEAYNSVFDFGCGCGRLARQMIQQDPRPARYLGVDLHPTMVRWCQENLAPAAPGFEFRHHDVAHPTRNPGAGKPNVLPFPVEDATSTLVVAHSVFTHLVQGQAEYYMREVARILAPDGVFVSTWFLFDKRIFPMMQEFQNALYINEIDPTNAVIFDRTWLFSAARAAGLTVYGAEPPIARGFQWTIHMSPATVGRPEVLLPADTAPLGTGLQAGPVEPELSA
jgi:SAM-dependent methyltransferase